MSANELALRFSTAPAEQLIGILPVLEVKEALRDEVEDDVLGEARRNTTLKWKRLESSSMRQFNWPENSN